MKKWLDKIIPAAPAVAPKRNLPVKTAAQPARVPVVANLKNLELTKGLPPATVVYGMAAGALFALALYFMFSGHWLNGFLTMLPAGCFLGFAVHLMKHGQ